MSGHFRFPTIDFQGRVPRSPDGLWFTQWQLRSSEFDDFSNLYGGEMVGGITTSAIQLKFDWALPSKF